MRCSATADKIQEHCKQNGKLWEKVFTRKAEPYLQGQTITSLLDEVKNDFEEVYNYGDQYQICQLMTFESFVPEIHQGCDTVDKLLEELSDMDKVMEMLAEDAQLLAKEKEEI